MNSAKLKETIANIVKEESEYQIFFRKALEKAGKSITDMNDEEKKAFFNKIDATWDGKGEKNEGNAFGAERAKAIASDNDSFKVDGKSYKVTGVDAEDKKNAEEFANESVNEAGKLKVGKEDFSFLLKLTDRELVKRLDLIRKQQLINGKQYMDARSKGEDTSKIEKVGENLANQEKAVIHARIRINESVNEGRKSKDSSGVRYVNAIYNNTNAIVKLVMDEKKDPKEVVDTMGPVLINAIKATLAHNYKPNSQPAYTLKRDLQRLGDLSNQQRIDVFKKGLKELLAVATELVKRPSQVGVKKLEERFRKLWNNEYGANIGLNGQGPHENTIIESVNEGVSPADMDKIKGAVEAASSFMSVGSELKKLGMKYTFATEPLPIYIIQPTPNNKVAVVNKKYATKPDFVVGDIAVGIMEGKLNEEEIKWDVVQNVIINFLKMNTKILDKRVQAKDTNGVKGGLKSIISGLVNAQRNLKLESVNEAGYTVKAENPYQFVNGAYAVLSAYLKDEELGPKGKRELQDIIKSLDYMRKYFYFKMSESVNEIKKGSIVMPYAMDKHGEFIVDKLFKNKSGETSYTGKFKKSGEAREFILHSKDRVVKESVNEDMETQLQKIASLTGLQPLAIKQFGFLQGLNFTKILKFIEKGKLKDRMDFVTAVVGNPGNPIQKKMIKMFQESVNEERDSNLFYVLYQKKMVNFQNHKQQDIKVEKMLKSLQNH